MVEIQIWNLLGVCVLCFLGGAIAGVVIGAFIDFLNENKNKIDER